MNELDLYNESLKKIWDSLNSEQKSLFNAFRECDANLRRKQNVDNQKNDLLRWQEELKLHEERVIKKFKEDLKAQELKNMNIMSIPKAWKRNLSSYKRAGF